MVDKKNLPSRHVSVGPNSAPHRAFYYAMGMTEKDISQPFVGVATTWNEAAPCNISLSRQAQAAKKGVKDANGTPREFTTITVTDGIAMGHDGMLYSLPSREIIADSVEYMVNAHCADAMVCISNCDKITPGMLMAALRLDIPVVFVSGGPMEAGKVDIDGELRKVDLVDAMIEAANPDMSDANVQAIEEAACPTCGSCSGMFTANSMNCLAEALGLALPGNGSTLATHSKREALFREAGRLIVDLTKRHYEKGEKDLTARGIATKAAFENAMTMDITMGGSTNTILHLLAMAKEAEVDFTVDDIDRLSRTTPCLCKVAPAVANVHMEDVHRAGGIFALLGELDRCGLLDTSVSMINRGKIRVAAREGKEIPKDVALDKYGKPTTDPRKALEGVQLPIAGFRGSGLAWMVDILSGVFTGGNHAGKVKDPFNDFTGPQNIGHLFIVMKPNLFVGNSYNKRIKENIKIIKKLPKIKGVKEIMYPGQNKFNRYKNNIKKEISIPDIIKEDLENLIS